MIVLHIQVSESNVTLQVTPLKFDAKQIEMGELPDRYKPHLAQPHSAQPHFGQLSASLTRRTITPRLHFFNEFPP